MSITISYGRERERKMEELRAVKSEYKEGLWNVNCVLMGGLGKDPTSPGLCVSCHCLSVCGYFALLGF